MSSTIKLNVIFEKKGFRKFSMDFSKKIRRFAYSFSVTDGKIMVGIARWKRLTFSAY